MSRLQQERDSKVEEASNLYTENEETRSLLQTERDKNAKLQAKLESLGNMICIRDNALVDGFNVPFA